MALKTFTWQPTSEASGTTQFRILTAQFGDGYTQTVADGIHNQSESWSLSFVAQRQQILAIKSFLDATKGTASFNWTPPLSSSILVKASEYHITPQGGDVYQLTVTFVQDYQP